MRNSNLISMIAKQWIPGILCLVLLTGCGFKLRGAYKLPLEMQNTYVDAAQPKSRFIRILKVALKASDINVVGEASDIAATLKIYGESRNKRIVSVDAKGRAREYTLTYSIKFSVKATENNFVIAEQTISIDRDFLFDTEDVLGNARGEAQLYEEMQQDLVRLMLLRLQSKS